MGGGGGGGCARDYVPAAHLPSTKSLSLTAEVKGPESFTLLDTLMIF